MHQGSVIRKVTLNALQCAENVVFLAKIDIESTHDVTDYRGERDVICGFYLSMLRSRHLSYIGALFKNIGIHIVQYCTDLVYIAALANETVSTGTTYCTTRIMTVFTPDRTDSDVF